MDIAEIKLTRVFSTSFRREIESFFEKYNTITTYILLKKKRKKGNVVELQWIMKIFLDSATPVSNRFDR